MKLNIEAEDLKIVKFILKNNIPENAKVWVFGSRAKENGKVKPFSDLDLALDFGRKLTLEELASLSKEFEESLLPYKVDLVDLWIIDDSFKKIIHQEKILLMQRDLGGKSGTST